jgi:hypothetical protein
MKTSTQKLNYEEYAYNKYESKIDVDIDTLVIDLLKCGRDRQKFNDIMKSLDSEFLGTEETQTKKPENLQSLGAFKEMNTETHRAYPGQNNMNNTNNKSEMKIMNNIYNLNSASRSNYDMEGSKPNSSVLKLTERNDRFNQFDHVGDKMKMNKLPGNNFHKKYTDVHANTKFYYPTEYSSYEDDDLNFEPSQWTNRANRTMFMSI